MMEAFLRRIQKHSIKREMENRMTWSVSKNEKFSIKAFDFFLTPRGGEAFQVIVVWNSWASTRFGFFTWEGSRGRVLTLD